MRRRPQPDRAWRWIVLIAVIFNSAFSYFSDGFMPGQSIVAITQKYNSLFTPAGYAFAIWCVIYFSFLSYAIYQLLPSQRNEPLFDKLTKPFILANALGIVWITVYRMDFIILSSIVIVTMFTASVILYLKVRNVVLRHERSNWISLPFSLFSGWLSVAMMANLSILFVSQGWEGSLPTQLTITMVMILIAGILGIFVSYRCADLVFPAVITWACVAIFIEHGTQYYSIGAVALISAALPLVWFLLAFVKRMGYRHRMLANKFSFDDTMRLKLNGQNKLIFGRL